MEHQPFHGSKELTLNERKILEGPIFHFYDSLVLQSLLQYWSGLNGYLNTLYQGIWSTRDDGRANSGGLFHPEVIP